MKWIVVLVTIVCLVVAVSSALAMSSTNFGLDWFVPLTNGGGGVVKSTNCSVDLTVGQTVIGDTTSDNFKTRLGYWHCEDCAWYNLMPVVVRE